MLKKRLENVANLIAEDNLIDIGTDHGYLLIDLVQKQKITRGLAVEVVQGPLDNVKDNVKRHGLDCIEFALSDGLTKVDKQNTDNYSSISICGMGGKLISDIITDSIDKFEGKTLYLQPNNGEQVLRRTLISNGFQITHEEVLIDNDIFYEIIKAIPGNQQLTDEEVYFGKCNLAASSDVFVAKYTDRLSHLQKISDKLRTNNVDDKHIKNEIELIEGVLNEVK